MDSATAVGWTMRGVVRAWGRAWNLGAPDVLGSPLAHRPEHAEPVILLNGIACDNEMWGAFARSLRRDGFQVTVADLPDKALGDIDATGMWLAGLVDRVRASTGAQKVDLVGYSEGGLIGRDYIAFHGGRRFVDAMVSLGTPHQGILVSQATHAVGQLGPVGRAVPLALRQMLAGSEFLTRLNAGDPTPGRVHYTSIRSAVWDGIVWPGASSVLEGAKNVVLPSHWPLPGWGPNHGELIQRSVDAYVAVRNALLA